MSSGGRTGRVPDAGAKSPWLRVYLGFFAIVLAPVAEEFVFRGTLFPLVKQFGFPKLALFGVSILFALIHVNAPTFVPLFFFALAQTWLYERTDNLLAPITVHALFNAANLIALSLVNSHITGHPSTMNEFELIARLTKSLPANESVVVGAGDDCAVLDLGVPEKLILFKTDAVVEGIHFTHETPPEKIGRKALARCLSDIAAMAGTPTAALVTIALPEKFE